ncbi:hypothetical protein H8A95_40805 [Bradyrhizobium sp. Pear76]|uniref:hypothetical protein n=1 Tax=Bradyrhizobium oropedii TaxID=1571201 RepID=UPI001E44DF77|nr:hypothetical protein [Bradyrhizobium oropedii]MCC8968459.1 hypothetical protein [Bradyrhizobium oropedii]
MNGFARQSLFFRQVHHPGDPRKRHWFPPTDAHRGRIGFQFSASEYLHLEAVVGAWPAWVQQEEQRLLRMIRDTDLTLREITPKLGRTEAAVRAGLTIIRKRLAEGARIACYASRRFVYL